MDSPAFSSENNTKTEDEVELYQIKIESMQKYVSFLNQLIEKLEQDASDEKKLIQMKIFQKMLTNNEKSRVSLIELTTCEDVLKKLYSVQNTDNTNVVCVPEQNVKTTKQKDPEKENISNSNNVEDIQNEKNSLQTTNKSNVESNMNLDNTDYKNLSTSDKIEKSESQKSKDSSNNIEENTDFYTNISENGKHDKYLDGESDNDVKTSQNINTENINGSTALNISKEAKTCTNESDAEVDYAENVEYINIPDDNEGSSSEMILPDSADEQEESGEHAVTNEFIKNNNLSEGNADSATAEEISENVKKVEDEASQDLVAEEPELIAVAENNEENFNSAGTLAEDITDDPLNANISKTNDTATMGAVNDINLKLNKADEDDDEVEVIETRNSPICIESDSDDGEIINSQQTITTKPTPSVINNPRPARTFARKSTATPSHVSNTIPEIQVQPKNFSYLQNQPVLSHRKRTSASASVVTIELSDSSDEESQKSKKSRTNFSTTNFVSPTKRRLLPLSVNKTKHPNSSKSPYLHTNSSKPDMFNTKTLKKCSSTIPQPIYVATPQSKFLQAVNLQPITSGQNPQAFSAQLSNKNVIIPNAFYGNPPAIRSIGNNSEGNSKGKQYTSVLSDSFGVNYTLELVYVRWLENFLHNFCSPQQIATPIALGLLQRVLKNKHFAKMVEIRQNLNNRPSKKDETISANLLVELRGLLLSNSKQLTGAGRALCEAACFYKGSKQTVALTTHRHNGTVGCRTKTIEEVQKEIQTFVGSKPISSTISSQPQEYSLTLTGSTRKRQNDDKEYTPNKSLNSSENLGERKSLRSTRGRKVVDKVFTYNEDELVDFDDSDDDSEEAVQRRIEQKRMQAMRQTQQQAKSFENAFIQTFAKNIESLPVASSSKSTNNHQQQIKIQQQDELLIIPDIGDVEDNLSNDDEPIEHRIYKVIPTELLSINNSLSSSSTSLATASYQQSNQQKKGRGRPRKSILENEDSNDKAEENLCQDDEDVVVIQSNNVSIEPSMAPRNTNKANVCSSSNSEWCIICQRRVPRIVHHYVNEHPGCEVYCSRLSDEEVEVLRRNKSTAKPSLYKNGQLQYEKECIFCSKVSRFMLPYWYQHFAMHTGEYAYRCDGCNIRKPTRSLMMAHIGQPCPKGGQICQDYNYENKSIEAKICMLCNYVQLNRANVTKHLRTQHKIKNVLPKHIQSIVLLRIPNAGRQSLHTPNSLKPNVNYSNLRTAPSAKTTTIRRTIGNEVFEISEIEDDQNVEAAAGYWSTTPNDDNNYLSNSADQWQSDEDGGFDLSYMICGMLDVEMNTNE